MSGRGLQSRDGGAWNQDLPERAEIVQQLVCLQYMHVPNGQPMCDTWEVGVEGGFLTFRAAHDAKER